MKRCDYLFSLITFLAVASVSSSARADLASCQSASTQSDAAQRALQALGASTPGGSGVKSGANGAGRSQGGLGAEQAAKAAAAKSAAEACKAACSGCDPVNPQGDPEKPKCDRIKDKCQKDGEKADQAAQQAAADKAGEEAAKETEKSAQMPPMQPPKPEEKPKDPQQLAEEKAKCKPEEQGKFDPNTGKFIQCVPKDKGPVITRDDRMCRINDGKEVCTESDGGTVVVIPKTGGDIDSDPFKIRFAAELKGLDPVRAKQRMKALFPEEKPYGKEGEVDPDLEGGPVPTLKDEITGGGARGRHKIMHQADTDGVSTGGKKGASKPKVKAAAIAPKTTEEQQRQDILLAVLDPRHNFNPYVYAEKQSNEIQDLIAKKEYCQASEQIQKLGTGDVHSQMAAAQLRRKLDETLDSSRQPTGEFGIGLLCNN